MTYKRNLGDFKSLEDVWKTYPSGGVEGDYLTVDGELLRWNTVVNQWEEPANTGPKPSVRTTDVFEGDVDINNNLNIGGILRARVVRGRSAFCGLYASEEELTKSQPHPLKGQWALVMLDNRTDEDGDAIGEVYRCPKDDMWEDAGYHGGCDGDIDALMTESEERKENDAFLMKALNEFKPVVIEGDVTNAADEEDITSDEQQLLKLKDKDYQPALFSGLGRKILRKNVVNSQNILTQDVVSQPNTVYVIQYDFSLNYEQISLPAGCVLEFHGGSISNGMLRGENTVLMYVRNLGDVIKNVTMFGTWKQSSALANLKDELDNRYTKSEVYNKEEILGLIPTPQQPVIYQNYPSYNDLPQPPAQIPEFVIFRVPHGETDSGMIDEYAWNNTLEEYVLLCTKPEAPIITNAEMDAVLSDE